MKFDYGVALSLSAFWLVAMVVFYFTVGTKPVTEVSEKCVCDRRYPKPCIGYFLLITAFLFFITIVALSKEMHSG